MAFDDVEELISGSSPEPPSEVPDTTYSESLDSSSQSLYTIDSEKFKEMKISVAQEDPSTSIDLSSSESIPDYEECFSRTTNSRSPLKNQSKLNLFSFLVLSIAYSYFL